MECLMGRSGGGPEGLSKTDLYFSKRGRMQGGQREADKSSKEEKEDLALGWAQLCLSDRRGTILPR